MDICMYCSAPLDMQVNNEAFAINDYLGEITMYHIVCRERAQAYQASINLHKLWCHLPDCDWTPFGEED